MNQEMSIALRPAAPQAIVIFGASGDLTRRKILPALYNLAAEGLLPERHSIIGYALSDFDDESFRRHALKSIEEFSRTPLDENVWKRFAPSLQFVTGAFDDPGRIAVLAQRLEQADAEHGCGGGRLYYLATPPSAFPVISNQLGDMPGGPGARERTRIVIEKPFGHDLASAQDLNETVHRSFDESQIFRIDHYLGKETVQNIMVFRFANSLWERVWNRDAIDHIQFTVAESIGVEGRGGYYEEAGALRDLVQNHMLQVLAFLTMEPPRALEPEAFRDEKVKLLKAIHPIGRMSSAPSTRGAGPVTARMPPATGRRTACLLGPRPRPSPRSSSISTTGVGPECPSTCGTASASPNEPRRSPSCSATPLRICSRRSGSRRCRRIT
jgi:glucose-6-phosphate 1-dehydrogenase